MTNITAERIFSITDSEDFEELALEIFRYQAGNNPVYHRYLELMGISPASISDLSGLPFLPIEFFRTHKVFCGEQTPESVFESSGTTGQGRSRHYLADTGLYRASFMRSFQHFFGPVEEYCILALLPSYLERSGSSLVYMAEQLIRESGHEMSGFYLDDFKGLASNLSKLESARQRSILLGVSFALLDLAEAFPLPLNNTLVMETGGMKGRREEITRQELHMRLCSSFSLEYIHSEYGMTELLSQAWSKKKGIFHTPPWMKVLIRDPYDPVTLVQNGRTGGINIIDLANLNSCAFIATQDLGKLTGDGFEVLGRFDNAELRGCNLMLD